MGKFGSMRYNRGGRQRAVASISRNLGRGINVQGKVVEVSTKVHRKGAKSFNLAEVAVYVTKVDAGMVGDGTGPVVEGEFDDRRNVVRLFPVKTVKTSDERNVFARVTDVQGADEVGLVRAGRIYRFNTIGGNINAANTLGATVIVQGVHMTHYVMEKRMDDKDEDAAAAGAAEANGDAAKAPQQNGDDKAAAPAPAATENGGEPAESIVIFRTRAKGISYVGAAPRLKNHGEMMDAATHDRIGVLAPDESCLAHEGVVHVGPSPKRARDAADRAEAANGFIEGPDVYVSDFRIELNDDDVATDGDGDAVMEDPDEAKEFYKKSPFVYETQTKTVLPRIGAIISGYAYGFNLANPYGFANEMVARLSHYGGENDFSVDMLPLLNSSFYMNSTDPRTVREYALVAPYMFGMFHMDVWYKHGVAKSRGHTQNTTLDATQNPAYDPANPDKVTVTVQEIFGSIVKLVTYMPDNLRRFGIPLSAAKAARLVSKAKEGTAATLPFVEDNYDAPMIINVTQTLRQKGGGGLAGLGEAAKEGHVELYAVPNLHVPEHQRHLLCRMTPEQGDQLLETYNKLNAERSKAADDAMDDDDAAPKISSHQTVEVQVPDADAPCTIDFYLRDPLFANVAYALKTAPTQAQARSKTREEIQKEMHEEFSDYYISQSPETVAERQAEVEVEVAERREQGTKRKEPDDAEEHKPAKEAKETKDADASESDAESESKGTKRKQPDDSEEEKDADEEEEEGEGEDFA